jgi:hypothetical protein
MLLLVSWMRSILSRTAVKSVWALAREDLESGKETHNARL